MLDYTAVAQKVGGVRAEVVEAFAARAEEVRRLAHETHADPEVSFEEHRASSRIVEFLTGAGFDAETGVGGLPTAFVASAGEGPATVAVCVEYDALPGVGHACGHNLIMGASVGAGVALRPLVDRLGIRLLLVGTPAEEHGGGKQLLLEAGVFDGVDAAMMVHPGPEDVTRSVVDATTNSVVRTRVTFTGCAAHAAAAPSQGVNAADAAVVAQVALGLLRQQLPDQQRVAAIVVHGGDVTNIIPARTVVDVEARATTLPAHRDLVAKVRRCFEGAAHATGCTVEFEDVEPLYEPLTQSPTLAALWSDGMAVLGHPVHDVPRLVPASTDMGNVSNRIPSIHPFAGIPGVHDPLHSAAFADAADTDAAYTLMAESALTMAWAVVALAENPDLRAALTREEADLAAALDGRD